MRSSGSSIGVPRHERADDRTASLRDSARITPERIAIDEAGRTWTYAELDARSDELAAALSHGERVSTLTGNSGEHVALMFACAKAGAILHPISWRLAPAEVAYQLDDAEPGVLPRRGRAPRAGRGSAGARARVQPSQDLVCVDSTQSGRSAGGRRPAAPDLHVRHDREAEGRAAHARELLLDEPLVRPRDRRRGPTTSSCRCCRSSTAAAGTCSRSSRGGRARRSCSSAASTRRAHST